MSVPEWVSKDFSHTFFDSETLYPHHIESLLEGNWLLDAIINFYFLYMENVKFKDQKEDILFLAPPTCMIVRWCDNVAIAENLNPLGISEKKLIFIPINDQDKSNTCGGSHWSLVVYKRSKDQYFFYDSLKGIGLSDALKFVRKIDKFINPSSVRYQVGLSKVRCQQQTNRSDCGVFCLAFSERVVSGESLTEGIDPSKFRTEIIDLIKQYYEKDGGENKKKRKIEPKQIKQEPEVQEKAKFQEEVKKIERKCIVCEKEGLKCCAGCKKEYYCGRECQLKHWKAHKKFCKKNRTKK